MDGGCKFTDPSCLRIAKAAQHAARSEAAPAAANALLKETAFEFQLSQYRHANSTSNKREPVLPRRTTLASLASGEEPPVYVSSMIRMTVARRFSGATDNADNGTDSLDIACDMITEESMNLGKLT
jgi:hypothetical protein